MRGYIINMVLIPFPKSRADEYRIKIALAKSIEDLQKIAASIEYDLERNAVFELVPVLLDAYLLLGKADEALSLLKSIEKEGRSPELDRFVVSYKVTALIMKEMPEEALKVIEEYESKHKGRSMPPDVRLSKVVTLVNVGRWEEAMREMENIDPGELENTNTELVAQISILLEEYKRGKEALEQEESFRRAYNLLTDKGLRVLPVVKEEDGWEEKMFFFVPPTKDVDKIVEIEDKAFKEIVDKVGTPYTVMALS